MWCAMAVSRMGRYWLLWKCKELRDTSIVFTRKCTWLQEIISPILLHLNMIKNEIQMDATWHDLIRQDTQFLLSWDGRCIPFPPAKKEFLRPLAIKGLRKKERINNGGNIRNKREINSVSFSGHVLSLHDIFSALKQRFCQSIFTSLPPGLFFAFPYLILFATCSTQKIK